MIKTRRNGKAEVGDNEKERILNKSQKNPRKQKKICGKEQKKNS